MRSFRGTYICFSATVPINVCILVADYLASPCATNLVICFTECFFAVRSVMNPSSAQNESVRRVNSESIADQ